jgi:uncharacterized membrane protein YphA (DoxX/SURF4 family)
MSVKEKRGWGKVAAELAPVAARWVLGALFIYMGLNKALQPADFLKLVRQYELVDGGVLLNLIGALLPWFEVYCGLLLFLGVAVRGAALLLVGMLIPFTIIVIRRALAIQAVGGQPFCSIRFDCGCGAGEVWICAKIVENAVLTLLCGALLFCRRSRLSLRHSLTSEAESSPGPQPGRALRA